MDYARLIKKLPRHVVAAAVLFLSSGATATAERASFDCKHAGLVDEKIICSDALLSRADYSLAQTYSELLAHADAARQGALRADQRNWLLSRNQECGVVKETKVTSSSRIRYIDCFMAAYEERARDFAAMKAEPDKPPGEISNPIRKSQFAGSEKPNAANPDITQTGLALNRQPAPAWSKDGRLIALAKLSGEAKPRLYAWQQGSETVPLSGVIEDAEKIQSLCIRDDKAILLRKASADIATEFTEIPLHGSSSKLPIPAWRPSTANNACNNLKRVQVISEDGKSRLDLGPLRWNASADDARFVTLKINGKSLAVKPLVRIDRRMPLAGLFVPGANIFIISVDNRPANLDGEIERRWAKSNCLPFWEISASSGEAKRECIPYGAYVKKVPQPLPTKDGLFFTAGNVGLYQSLGDSASQLIHGDVVMPGIAPDQCHISFANTMAKGDGKSRALQVLNVCTEAR